VRAQESWHQASRGRIVRAKNASTGGVILKAPVPY